jgi:hypothetical protein
MSHELVHKTSKHHSSHPEAWGPIRGEKQQLFIGLLNQSVSVPFTAEFYGKERWTSDSYRSLLALGPLGKILNALCLLSLLEIQN